MSYWCRFFVFVALSAAALGQPKLDQDAHLMTPAESSAIASAADGVALSVPMHLVFVGDSLTAFFPDLNYVAVIQKELQKRWGEKVTVANAGVRGDTITRVRARLEKDVLTLVPTPTHVFVFLGHNDSKVSFASHYLKSEVSLVEFESAYRTIIGLIQNRLKARVIVISTASSVFELTKAAADRSAQAGKAHNLFGDPVSLEKFNDTARRVAAETGAGYLDIYTPMKAVARKSELFVSDGVHLNQHGNRFVAVKILEYLANSDPQQRMK